MARRRFFVEEVRNGQAQLLEEEARHLTRVLRVEAGQRYEISDNERVFLAEVTDARKDLVRFAVIEELAPGGPAAPLVLVAALIKFDRFEWTVEKATELGVERIVPVESERSDYGLLKAAEKRVERWRKIAREASQQSRRQFLPVIDEPLPLRKLEAAAWPHRRMLEELPGTAVLEFPEPWAEHERLALLAGPEGGWTDAERERLAGQGWTASSLGEQVLRAETAAVSALAVAGWAWQRRARPLH